MFENVFGGDKLEVVLTITALVAMKFATRRCVFFSAFFSCSVVEHLRINTIGAFQNKGNLRGATLSALGLYKI